MTRLRRVTSRATLLALLAVPMVASSAAASSISESGGTLTIAAAGTQGGAPELAIASYTDVVFVYSDMGGDSAGQGCSGSHSGEVTICDATGLTSIVIDSSGAPAQASYTAYASMTPLPLTVDFGYPISNQGVAASFTQNPGRSVRPLGVGTGRPVGARPGWHHNRCANHHQR